MKKNRFLNLSEKNPKLIREKLKIFIKRSICYGQGSRKT